MIERRTDLKISKLYNRCCRLSTSGTSGPPLTDNQTVRNVFVIGRTKSKLVLVY